MILANSSCYFVTRPYSKGVAVRRRGTRGRMPYTEMDNITLTKLALISERARKEPKFQFTSLAHLLNEGFPEGMLLQTRQGPSQWH
jgi:hypothetical protein